MNYTAKTWWILSEIKFNGTEWRGAVSSLSSAAVEPQSHGLFEMWFSLSSGAIRCCQCHNACFEQIKINYKYQKSFSLAQMFDIVEITFPTRELNAIIHSLPAFTLINIAQFNGVAVSACIRACIFSAFIDNISVLFEMVAVVKCSK